jgi:hypothetical protein
MLNRKQSLIRTIGLSVICLVLLFPPWTYESRRSDAYYKFLAGLVDASEVEDPVGPLYITKLSFFLAPPKEGYTPHIDGLVLGLIICIVGTITASGVYRTQDKRTGKDQRMISHEMQP